MSPRPLRRPLVLLVGALTAVAVSACGSSSTPAASTSPGVQTLKVAIVEPSLRNDLAFSQSMYQSVQAVAGSLHLQVAVSDNLFNVSDAANAMHQYASQGYNLIIAHGSQYGGTVQQLAPQFPKVSFAWGTAGVTFGLPNVFAYQANAQEGAYVMGYEAAMLSKSKTIGVLGPIDVGDGHLFVVGFKAGALAQDPSAKVLTSFTGSFSDTTLMASAANSAIAAGADVLTGTSQSVVGAIGVCKDKNAAWFGTQSDQSSLASSNVVASQVYDWSGVITQIITAIRGGVLGGATYTITLGNNGEKIAYNSGYSLDPAIKTAGDGIAQKIISGSITPPTN